MLKRFVLCDQLVIFLTKQCFLSLESEEEAEMEEVVTQKKGDPAQKGGKCK